MARRRSANRPRVGVRIEAPTPALYRWFVGQASPYVARRADDGTFTVLDEERWSALLSAAEAKEIP